VGNDNTIWASSLPGSAGTVDIRVTGPGGTSLINSATDQFTYFVPPPPEVNKLSPNSGPSVGGTTVTIIGNNLLGVNRIMFGPNQTYFGFGGGVSDHIIQTQSPPGTASPTPVHVTVSTPAATSSPNPGDLFTVTASPPPLVSGVSPNTGPSAGGTMVLISGRNLAGATSVKFGLADVFIQGKGFGPQSPDLLRVMSPPGTVSATPVHVTVTTPAGTSSTSSADQFTYGTTAAPSLRSITPNSGPEAGGTQVITSGSNLAGASSVTFGTASAVNFKLAAPDVIWVTSPSKVPADASSVDVRVTTPGGTSGTGATFTYIANPTPTIDTVSPNRGPSGTSVVITGSNFYGPTDVAFGGIAAAFVFRMAPGVIAAVSPPKAPFVLPVDVKVTTAAGSSTATGAYTYTAAAAPGIDVVSPSFGPAGTAVIITGSGLGDVTGVDFGSTPAAYFARSDTLIRATSPAGTGTLDITIKTAAGKTFTKCGAYTYGTGAGQTTFYFAEGYTGAGFTEKLFLLTPNQGGVATIDYYMAGGVHTSSCESLTAGKVTVVDVNAKVGPDKQVSVKVTLPAPGIAERTLNFDTGTWHGSTGIVGTTAPSTEWDFAEGSTYDFFSEFLTLQNPTNTRVIATLNYFTDTGLTPSKTLSLPPNSRTTVEVFKGGTGNVTNCVPSGAGANCGVGLGIGGVSVQVLSNSLPIIAERPFYVNGFNFGDGVIRDGHDAFGATAPATTWNFAEGTTIPGFREYLTLQNPGNNDATVSLNYVTDSVGSPVKTLTVRAHSRVTVEVFSGTTASVNNCVPSGAGASCGLGRGAGGTGIGGVSVQITSSVPIVAERPMYMSLNFGTGIVAGAHVVVGANGLAKLFGFAAASTLAGDLTYLTIQNPGGIVANITATYYTSGGPLVRNFTVAPNSRKTVEVFKATEGAGPNYSPLGIVVSSDQPILVEKPTYSSNQLTYGATDTLGYSPQAF
jgi:hypothetical protein